MSRVRSSGFLLKVLCLTSLVAAIGGCETDPNKQASKPTQSDPSKGIICTYEVPTGSTLRERKCTTPEQREAERAQSDHQIQVDPRAR